jgi:hypothetical protein
MYGNDRKLNRTIISLFAIRYSLLALIAPSTHAAAQQEGRIGNGE